MTGTHAQPKARRERRIIERPRLIKLLDDCEARIILLLAPAGYGKTTLARQWAKTLNGGIWISCTPAHRDVAVLAEDLARGLDRGDGQLAKLVREFVAAHANPQHVGRQIARALCDRISTTDAHCLLIDDYHELIGSAEAEEFVASFQQYASCRFMIASRQRPSWITSKRILYGEVTEIGREQLAMDESESSVLLGDAVRSRNLAQQAEGWPAVLALAAAADAKAAPAGALPSALHDYFAEELFQRATPELQARLIDMALLPHLASPNEDGHDHTQAVAEAAELGFVATDGRPEMHPLLREFLLDKISSLPSSRSRLDDAIRHCLTTEEWDAALRLVERFRRHDWVEPVIRETYKPLVRSGRLETLSQFASTIRAAPSFPPVSVDVIEAESAIRDGNLELAADLSLRVRHRLGDEHPLRSRASAIHGQCSFLLARFEAAEAAFLDARRTATDDEDDTEALHGLGLCRTFSEQGDAETPSRESWARRHWSPTHLLRAATFEISRRRLAEGLAAPLYLEEPLHAARQVEDPRVRTSFYYTAAYALAQQGRYRSAKEWVDRFWKDVREYDLEFARPHVAWTAALINLGLRRFGETERLLQSLEDAAAARQDGSHLLNARILRARLLLETGKTADACALTSEPSSEASYPSWRAEYLATRALALASSGLTEEARSAASEAVALSRMAEVRVLAAAALAVAAVVDGNDSAALGVVGVASELGIWDPVVCALRTSRPLANLFASKQHLRPLLQDLYVHSNDRGLARLAGFRTRSTLAPDELLTPRELEVLELITRGMSNSEIASALFISHSTAKVHVRHVLEKLGVRSRAQAVARSQMFN
jgi:LuxR family maltose regulon positive regulatory protein